MRYIIRLFDRLLRRLQGVFVYWDDPDCMFRVSHGEAPHPISLPDGEIPAGAKVLYLHFWNEHMPHIPPEGPNVRLALHGVRMLRDSFRVLAHQVRLNPLLAGVQAVGTPAAALVYPDAGPGGEKLMERLGFTCFPYRHPLGRFGEFWENFYTWAIIWTYNEKTLQGRRLTRMKRFEFWMSVDTLVRTHARSDDPVAKGKDPQPTSAPANG